VTRAACNLGCTSAFAGPEVLDDSGQSLQTSFQLHLKVRGPGSAAGGSVALGLCLSIRADLSDAPGAAMSGIAHSLGAADAGAGVRFAPLLSRLTNERLLTRLRRPPHAYPR
jgi:hypothetical protein